MFFLSRTNFESPSDLFLFTKEIFNPLCANFTKWSKTLKQFVGKLPTNCLSMFDHFVGLALKGLMKSFIFYAMHLCMSYSLDIQTKSSDHITSLYLIEHLMYIHFSSFRLFTASYCSIESHCHFRHRFTSNLLRCFFHKTHLSFYSIVISRY